MNGRWNSEWGMRNGNGCKAKGRDLQILIYLVVAAQPVTRNERQVPETRNRR